MIGISSPIQGSGKSYLVDLLCIIATGYRAPVLATGSDVKELEKALTAALMDGRPFYRFTI
jgi:hypothetical protein